MSASDYDKNPNDRPMADSLMDEAIRLAARIAAKERESAALLVQLQQSLRIRDIWSDAFKHGSCKVAGRGKWADRQHPHHTRKQANPNMGRGTMWYVGYIIDGEGMKYYLTAEELTRLKPDVLIHPDYEDPYDRQSRLG